jgi:hypothetical protein
MPRVSVVLFNQARHPQRLAAGVSLAQSVAIPVENKGNNNLHFFFYGVITTV